MGIRSLACPNKAAELGSARYPCPASMSGFLAERLMNRRGHGRKGSLPGVPA